MPTPTPLNETHVDAVARSLHRHHEARHKGIWPNIWDEYDNLDEKYRNEYRNRATEVIKAVQGTDTLDEATMYLAALWCPHGPAMVKYMPYAHERITETLSDVPTLKETK